MSHIFISYNRKDMSDDDRVLQRLVSRLRRNFNIWLDKTDIVPGTNWQGALEQAIKTGSAMVFIMSPNAVASHWCLEEVSAARSAGIPIIPYVYRKADFPLGMSTTHAIFHEDSPDPQAELENALKQHAPQAYIHSESRLIAENLINSRDVTFADVASGLQDVKTFIIQPDDDHEIELFGLPVIQTSFCTSYLVGRADDTLAYKPRVQLALQFSGRYESPDFPAKIAAHFLKDDPQFNLRMLLVRGPAQITYDARAETNSVNYVLDPPTADENQWSDALHAIQSALAQLHHNRESPGLQIFVQGPVAGITYALGAEHRGLSYRAEHYQFDRDNERYYRVLGALKP